jgi:Icc-related predicted phosphoesterase
MKILAVSDEPSRSLEALIADKPGHYKDIDVVVSCGDLSDEYLEYVVEGIKREFYFITGNHPLKVSKDYLEPQNFTFPAGGIKYIAGEADLHGRIELFKNYILVGFGGSMWYNGEENQFTEKEMAKVVKAAERKIRWYRLQDKLFRRQPREVIVISHAPIAGVHDQPDRAHRGFKCFEGFIKNISPLLWLHGHIHMVNQYTNQISLVGSTTVVNVFGCKVLDIKSKSIQVLSHCVSS